MKEKWNNVRKNMIEFQKIKKRESFEALWPLVVKLKSPLALSRERSVLDLSLSDGLLVSWSENPSKDY